MTPRVSIVIPTYNSAPYVRDTLASVLSQSFGDLEVVVADHASVDGTWEVLQEFAGDPRVRLMQTPTGGGAKRNWDVVCEAATGELVKLVCADDLIYPECVALQVKALDDHPSAGFVASPRDIIDASGTVVVRGRGLGGLQGAVDGRLAVRRSVRAGTNIFGEPGCVMFRRSTWAGLEAGWDDAFPYLIDQYTYAQMLLTVDLVAVPRTLAAFRISADQWSVRLARSQSDQATHMHAALRVREPELLSRADVALGDARAVGMAVLRRAAYVYLRRRMGRATHG